MNMGLQSGCEKSGIQFAEKNNTGGVSGTILVSVISGLGTLHQWRRNSRTRRQLANLSPELRQDIGLSDAEISNEVNKPFWKK